jgi:hypothetical protein
MASNPLKRVRGRLIFARFFCLWWSGLFAGVFAKSWCANVVFWMVNRGEFVVKTWLRDDSFIGLNKWDRFLGFIFRSGKTNVECCLLDKEQAKATTNTGILRFALG